MAYDWLDGYLMDKPGVVKDFKVEWGMTRYMIAEKMFAAFGGDKYAKPIFTVKLDPAFGECLRNQYTCVVPGYYMNKVHWNSMYLDGDVPDETVRQMADNAYEITVKKLTKKEQEAVKCTALNNPI